LALDADRTSDATALERCVKLDAMESAVQHAVTTESPGRAEAVEGLVAALLSGGLGLAPRATDGFVPLREEIGAARYFAVGMVYMIEDQSTRAVWLDLVLTESGIASGTVRVGVDSVGQWRGGGQKLENDLLAYPHETVAMLEWACAFERRSGGWMLRGAAAPDP
jgi:hypothetical protein